MEKRFSGFLLFLILFWNYLNYFPIYFYLNFQSFILTYNSKDNILLLTKFITSFIKIK